jgi:hypothetical protein
MQKTWCVWEDQVFSCQTVEKQRWSNHTCSLCNDWKFINQVVQNILLLEWFGKISSQCRWQNCGPVQMWWEYLNLATSRNVDVLICTHDKPILCATVGRTPARINVSFSFPFFLFRASAFTDSSLRCPDLSG